MNDRDRLVELLEQGENKCYGHECEMCKYQPSSNCYWELVADHLIENGVSIDRHGEWKIQRHLLSGCKTIYCSECNFRMERGPAWEIDWGLPAYCSQCGAKIGKIVFLTREEAEAELRKRSKTKCPIN